MFERFRRPMTDCLENGTGDCQAPENIARQLWMAAILGPDVEEETWENLRTTYGWSDGQLAKMQTRYRASMRPLLSDDEIQAMQQRYHS